VKRETRVFLVRDRRIRCVLVNHLHHFDLSDSLSPTREQTATIAPAILHVLPARHDYPETVVGSRSRRILAKISRNTFRGTATSAIWKITDRA